MCSPFPLATPSGYLVHPMPKGTLYLNIKYTRLPSGKCLGEWRKDTLLSLPDVMAIFVGTYENLARKNIEFTFYPHSTSWVYSI